jgi:hypothetical protein
MLGAKLILKTNMKQKKEWYYYCLADVSFVILVVIVASVPFAKNLYGTTHNGNPHRVGYGIFCFLSSLSS